MPDLPKWFSTAALAILAMGSSFGRAEDRVVRTEERPANVIVVPQCRVQLIDQVVLASEATGVLDELAVEEGDQVERGAQVAGLKREAAVASLAVAERQATDDFELKYARKAAELATAENERTRKLFLKGVVSDSDFEKSRLEKERAALMVDKAESQMTINQLMRDEKKAQLAAFVLRTPLTGRVIRVFHRPGEAVRAGDPIVEIASVQRLRVEGYVPAAEARLLRRDAEAIVEPDRDPEAAPETCQGRIVFVDDSIEPNSQTVRVWAEVDNARAQLRPGQSATLRCLSGKSRVIRQP